MDDGLIDGIAPADIGNDASPSLAPAAPSPSPSPPAPAKGAEPSRLDTIRDAVDRQKAKASESPDAPAKSAAPVTSDRARAPDGKFAPGETKPAVPTPGTAAAPTPGSDGAAAPGSRPPPGWSPASKAAFDTLPDHIKADVAKREEEVNRGFQKLASYKSIDPYVEMATRGGTTLDKALENYVGIENLLRRDVFAGIDQVLRNVGVKPAAFFQAYLQRAAGGDQTQQQPAPGYQQPQFDPRQLADQIKQELVADSHKRVSESAVDEFLNDPANKFAANVESVMAGLLTSGAIKGDLPLKQRLKVAYDVACRADPEISALISQAPANQGATDVRAAGAPAIAARAAARAVTGSPANGIAPAGQTLRANMTTREVMQSAIVAQRGRV